MGRPKDHDNYSPQIRDWVEKLSKATKPVSVTLNMPTPAAATALRSTFYSYLKAAGGDANQPELQLRIATFRRTYLMRVRGNALIFALRFDEPLMDILTEKMLEMDLGDKS